jgi:hypothetical protein
MGLAWCQLRVTRLQAPLVIGLTSDSAGIPVFTRLIFLLSPNIIIGVPEDNDCDRGGEYCTMSQLPSPSTITDVHSNSACFKP